MEVFNTKYLKLIKRSLDVYDKQHQAISENVSNANNGNYKRVDTDFSAVLQGKMDSNLKVSNNRHITSSKSQFFKNKSSGKVDLQKEMGELAINQIKFDFATRVLKRIYSGLSDSIKGRNS